MSFIETDICIIGAGPAGATTALFLAKMGIPHLIVDAATFPRDKVCGDGLDLKVMRVLHQLDPAIITNDMEEGDHFAKAWGARFITPNGKTVDFCRKPEGNEPDHPLYRVARRKSFDQFLVDRFDRRYTDFRPATKVLSLIRQGAYWHIQIQHNGITEEIRARCIVGADGDQSVVLRSLGERKIDRRHYAAAQRQYWSGVEGIHSDQLIEFYFPPSLPWSYFWIFPLPNGHVNVGFIMLSETATRLHTHIREELQRIIKEDPVIAPRFRNAKALEKPVGWGLPLASGKRQLSGAGYLLVGDAASLICPLTGEGIGTGMQSGLIAAHFLQKATQTQCFDAQTFAGYSVEVYRRMRTEIRMANIARRFQRMPWGIGTVALNTVLPSRFFQWMYKRMAGGWLNTAFNKPFQVRSE